jgi:hypothetical protein
VQNNNLLVSGSQDGTAKLWNPNSGKCVGTLMAGKGQEGAFQSSAPNMAKAVLRIHGILAADPWILLFSSLTFQMPTKD